MVVVCQPVQRGPFSPLLQRNSTTSSPSREIRCREMEPDESLTPPHSWTASFQLGGVFVFDWSSLAAGGLRSFRRFRFTHDLLGRLTLDMPTDLVLSG